LPYLFKGTSIFLHYMNQKQPVSPATFDGLGISPNILSVLQKNKFTKPTPIQHQAIPLGIQGKDLVGVAQTGTGKTLAFAIPLIQRIPTVKGTALILLPTRELASQVDEEIRKIGSTLGIRTAVVIGGEKMGKQLAQLRRRPHVIIATPGRLNDYRERKIVNLSQVKIVILDEADRMLDMGFAPQLKKILQEIPRQRQTMLFSATMPPEIVKIATREMNLPLRIEVAPPGMSAETIEQEIIIVKQESKFALLEKLLQDYHGTVLVFSRTKHNARKISHKLRGAGYEAAEIHSNRTLSQRRAALAGFKSGRFRVLVATDIAARGIDVNNIELVINFDLPDAAEDYVHRIGRTGRAGKQGRAISFATPRQRKGVMAIERLIRKPLKVSPQGEQQFGRDESGSSYSGRRQQRSYGGGGGGGGGYRGRSSRSGGGRRGQSQGRGFRPKSGGPRPRWNRSNSMRNRSK
jgi:ATP-dependent RNA helicase RhlE